MISCNRMPRRGRADSRRRRTPPGRAAPTARFTVLALAACGLVAGAAAFGRGGGLAGAAAIGRHAQAHPARPAATATWQLRLAIHYLPPASNRSGYDAVLAEPGVTWFFGGSNLGGPGRPEAELLRNGRPTFVPLPPGPHSWITAVSAISRSDIWAVTYQGGSVLRWNGSAWSSVPRGNWRTGTRFTGIAAVSPRDVWVFGTTSLHFIGAGTWHFDGRSWTRATGPGGGLYQASIAAPGDIWGIGVKRVGFGVSKNKVLLHFAGSAWHQTAPPALAGFVYSRVLALGPGNVWVAGTVNGRPELGHFDGRGWTAVTMPGAVAATGMCRDGTGGLWVIANTGTSPSIVRHRSASGTWTRSVVSANRADEILACALEPGTTRVWGAGTAAAPQGRAAAGYRRG